MENQTFQNEQVDALKQKLSTNKYSKGIFITSKPTLPNLILNASMMQ